MKQASRQEYFESLFQPLLGAAYGTALHLTRSQDDAEDLVQDAAVQAFRALDTFQPGTHFKAWFFRIMTNLFFHRYRKKRREPEIAELEEAPDLYLYTQARGAGQMGDAADPAALVMGKLDTEHVVAAIARLPEEYRLVAALYLLHEFSYQEIGEIVDCPVGTVRSRLHRGRKILQKALWQVAAAQGLAAGGAENQQNNAPPGSPDV